MEEKVKEICTKLNKKTSKDYPLNNLEILGKRNKDVIKTCSSSFEIQGGGGRGGEGTPMRPSTKALHQ